MKNNKLLYLLLIALLVKCTTQGKEKKTDELPSDKTEVWLLKKDKLHTAIQLPGELQAFRQVDLYAKVSSFVKSLSVDIGSEVREGQLLISLEAPEISSQAAAAASRLQSQEAVYAASKSTYERLLETSKVPGTISQNELDLATSKKNSDSAQLEAARAAYREVTEMKSYLEIRAPFSGIITSRNVNPGAYVGPSGKGSEFPLLTLQEQKLLRLIVSVPETWTSILKNGSEVSFKVKAFPGENYTAKIKRMSGALDTRLRAERVEMDVINTDKKLLSGMVAEVTLSLASNESTFVIPATALVNSAEGNFVIKVVNHKAQWVPVKKGKMQKDQIEIFGDLQENDTLVVKANEEIRNGAVVKN